MSSGAFSSEVESSEVHQYPNLFDAPVVRRVQGVHRYVGRAQERRLNKAFEIDLPDAPEPAIRAALEPASIAAGIAIYDVGQGNCNAILNESGYPSLYFDVGGGVAQNRHTFPAALQRFCVQQVEQTIVLSHWDHDHWSSAVRFHELQKLRWIIPRQRLGGKHAAFLSSLRAKAGEANVLVWPEHLSHLQVGDVTVIRCSGPRTDRNRSGLALIIEPKHRNLRKRVLLPGDCPYRYIDAGADAYTSLVVSHHGGRTDRRKTAAVPRSDGDSCGRLVYSVGSGNSYNHPLPDVMASHAASWGTSRLTTKRRGKVGLGHVHLYWDNADPDIQLLCGGTGCDLVCYQR